jgi:hypothetical protein
MNPHAARRGSASKILARLQMMFWVFGIALALFALLNLAAAFLLTRASKDGGSSIFNHVIWPHTAAGTDVLRRIFRAGSNAEALVRIDSAPGFEMHPTLHYMTARTNNSHYRIGLEGIRYDQGWDDASVTAMLKSNNDLIFLMGGSTTLGHGVSGNETISWFLNRSLPPTTGPRALNFGAQAYDQHRELEKLVYLLRIGYRPRAVVFLDGWNDLVGTARSNMRWQDKVIFHGFSANRGTIAYTPGTANVNYVRQFAESLPVVRWMHMRNAPFTVAEVMDRRDPFVQGFDFREAGWVFAYWEQYIIQKPDMMREQLLESYRANMTFLKHLSETFGFKLLVLLQPMGLFERRNPFVLESARKHPTYSLLLNLRAALRNAISAGTLPMHDASDVLAAVEDSYVDVAHYSPAANKALADFILHAIDK